MSEPYANGAKGDCMAGWNEGVWKIVCCPCQLVFKSFTIYMLSCITVFFHTVWMRLANVCCGCWQFLCCDNCGCTAHFEDKEFPAFSERTLGNDGADHSKVSWQRLEDYLEGQVDSKGRPLRAQLVEGQIEPNDINQGDIGDCWLLSAFAAVAEHPALLRRIFVSKAKNAYGKYTFKIYDALNDKWEYVSVDTWVPIEGGRVRHCDPHNNEMWCCLLEKAFAKFCGSYANLIGGNTAWALTALTGFPTFSIRQCEGRPGLYERWDMIWMGGDNRRKIGATPHPAGLKWNAEDLFYVMREYDYNRAVMNASVIRGNSDAETSPEGLVLRHAYSVLRVVEIKHKKLKMIRMRNPWGSGEWQGRWCDSDPQWRDPANCYMVQELDFRATNDGSFWMDFDDFLRNFGEITICPRRSGFSDLALEVDEELYCFGICTGCVKGCACFWCGCRGPSAYCCSGNENDTVEGKRDLGCCDVDCRCH